MKTDKELDIQIGMNLRYLRTRTFKEKRNRFNKLVIKPLTQTEVAQCINVTFQSMQKYENATNKIDSVKLYRLSKFFGVPLDFFFDEHLISRQTYTKIFREDNVQQQHNI